jgi:CRP-like cAMP-binding protein
MQSPVPPSQDGITQAEKIGILKSVSIFFDTPDEILAKVADLLEEVAVKAGDSVFEKGDLGTSMYIVVSGSVWVHDGDMSINYLYARDVFGEMAALDPEPRSASVTAVDDTHLFQLTRENLHEVMMRAPAIAEGIITILCERVRARVSDMKEDYLYMQQFAKVTSAATAVENGVYIPEALDDVAARTDALGRLARVFQSMMRQVYTREQRFKQQIAELHIEIDEARKATQVSEITDTEYFQQLKQQASTLRQSRK